MRKIGALVHNWNQEPYIEAYLNMLARHVDKIVVILHQVPLRQYEIEHYGSRKDRSEEIIRKHPSVEYYEHTFVGEFCAEFLNTGLDRLKDCDIVMRLDSDMFLTDADMRRLVGFIRDTKYDCYRLDWAPYVINYYVTNRFDIGIFDSLEEDIPMAFNPREGLTHAVSYPEHNSYKIEWDGFRIHHLRGWRNCFPEGWQNSPAADELRERYGNFVTLPTEIIDLLKCQEIHRNTSSTR